MKNIFEVVLQIFLFVKCLVGIRPKLEKSQLELSVGKSPVGFSPVGTAPEAYLSKLFFLL